MLFWIILILILLVLVIALLSVIFTIYYAATKPSNFISDIIHRKTGVRINF